jgi:putative ABC transport system substrate-binding protein
LVCHDLKNDIRYLSENASSGLVPRLNQPSGNITGFASYEPSLGGKWLELLSEIAPGLKRAALMFNPDLGPQLLMPSLETAARLLKVTPIIALVHSKVEIERAIIDLGSEPGGGLVVMPGIPTLDRASIIISAAARANVPAVYSLSDFVRDGAPPTESRA